MEGVFYVSYRISKKFDSNERQNILGIIQRGVRSDKTATEIRNNLRSRGYGYTDKNMYHDIRRKTASFQAKDTQSRNNALKWFDKVFEPFRKDKGYSGKQANKTWDNARNQIQESELELSERLEIWEIYEMAKIKNST